MRTALPADIAPTLDAGLRALGVDVAHAPTLLDYLGLLVRWNGTYNLTAIRDPREMVVKHLLDSLSMHAHVAAIAARGGRLADLGTGAGLPGIPLAIVYPGLQVTLVESAGKKVRFMREAIRTLALPNAHAVEARIEAVDEAGAFDAITARALATLPLLVELGGPLLAPHGVLLAMKGIDPIDEIAALPPGWHVIARERLHVPGLEAERHLVTVQRAAAAGPARA